MKKVYSVIVGCMICFCFLSVGKAVDLSAKSAILCEASTGKIFYQKNIEEQLPIASTTKIMTALLVIENADLDDVVTIKPEYTGIEGSSLYLKAGEKISVETLLYGLMLQSGNDAAVTLAYYVGGDIPTFVSMMNARAQEIGMERTHFENPNGLPAEGHVSTALDMAKLACVAMQNAQFQKIVSTQNYVADGRAFRNHNKLLKMREDIDGVKTGFTKAAGRCLVSSSVRDHMRLVVVTLSAPDDWNDHLALYDYGFQTFGKKDFIQAEERIAQLPIVGSGLHIAVKASKMLSYVDKKNALDAVEEEIYLPHFCYAPVHKGDVVGKIKIKKEGKVIAECDLIATESVVIPEKKGFWERYFGWLWN